MVSKFVQPDYTNDGGSAYPLNIDAAIAALAQVAANFAPSEQDTPDMTVLVREGKIWTGSSLVSVADQSTGTITAPSTNPRIDRVVIDASDGTVSIVNGTEAATPTAPTVLTGQLPICQILLQTNSTTITNSMLTDERPLMQFPGLRSYFSDPTDIDYNGTISTVFLMNGYANSSGFETVGPTGSGADHIWTALDSVPDGAAFIDVHVHNYLRASSTGSSVDCIAESAVNAVSNDSTSPNSSYFTYISWNKNEVTSTQSGLKFGGATLLGSRIQLDSNKMFKVNWLWSFTNCIYSTGFWRMILRGWG